MKVKCIGWYGSCCIHLCVCLHGELFDGLLKTCKRFELKRKQSKNNPRKSSRCVVLKWIGKNCLQEAAHYFVNTKGQTKWSIFESFVKSHWPSSVTSTHWVVLGLPAQCKEGLVLLALSVDWHFLLFLCANFRSVSSCHVASFPLIGRSFTA